MKRFRKVYLEISNICNMHCSFCPGTKRAKHAMTEAEFSLLLERLQPWTDHLYFHLMGEPLCHGQLGRFLELAGSAGFRVILTTNGTLLPQWQDVLLAAPALHKVNISLHSFEANRVFIPFAQYVQGCMDYGIAAAGQKLTVYRLWNRGGADERNRQLLEALHAHFPEPWVTEPRGTRIAQRTYLEYGDRFDWPDLLASDGGEACFCYGLRDQLGVLCDGTVVPCCLDHEGDIALGNLLQTPLEDILATERAQALYNGFSHRRATEPLCRRCGYARRFG